MDDELLLNVNPPASVLASSTKVMGQELTADDSDGTSLLGLQLCSGRHIVSQDITERAWTPEKSRLEAQHGAFLGLVAEIQEQTRKRRERPLLATVHLNARVTRINCTGDREVRWTLEDCHAAQARALLPS